MTATPGRSEDLWVMLEALIENDPQKRFETFVKRNSTNGWLIGSDYVIADKTRPNDCMCFSVYPVDEKDPLREWREIPKVLPRDFKNTKTIDETMVSFLRNDRQFSFCFIITKERNPDIDRDMAKATIDGNIAIMMGWKDADRQRECIARMRKLRQSAEAKAFNAHLLADMFTVTNIVTVIAYLLTKWASPRIVGWYSDRDKITTAYGKIANDLFVINYSAICQQRGVEFRGVELCVGDPRPDPQFPKRSWYDALIRIPDYLAGILATFIYQEGTSVGGGQKVLDMITKVLRNASNLSIIALERDGDRLMPVYVNITEKTDAPYRRAKRKRLMRPEVGAAVPFLNGRTGDISKWWTHPM
jgi:hypothetical protein